MGKKWIKINKQSEEKEKEEKISRENENINHFDLVFHFDFNGARRIVRAMQTLYAVLKIVYQKQTRCLINIH